MSIPQSLPKLEPKARMHDDEKLAHRASSHQDGDGT